MAAAPELEPEFHVGDYLERLRRRWKLVAVLVVVCLAGAAIKYAITPKEFRAATRIQIESRSLSPINGVENPWLENFLNIRYYPTQYELLKSRGLAERVVMNLGLFDDPSFNPGGEAMAGLDVDTLDPESADAAVLGQLAARLGGGLEVKQVGDTQLFDIAYRASSPEFAARAANGFAEAFIDWGITTRTTTAGRASSFLSSQVESLKREIDDKEARLQAFSRETDILSLDRESNVVLQRLQALNTDYMEAKGARIEKEVRYKELQEMPRQEVADSYADGTIDELMRDQLALEREYESKLQTYKPEWPAMVELAAQIEQGRKNLEKSITEGVATAKQTAYAEYQRALRKERTLEAELQSIKSELLDQSSAAVDLTNLQLEIASSRELMDKLLRQQSETEVAARLQGTRESNIRIIDRALVPGGAFRPSLRQNLTTGLGLGLMLGLGALLLLEYMDRSIKSPEEVERRLAVANLAVIPDVASTGRSYGTGLSYGYAYGRKGRKKGGKLRLRNLGDRKEGAGAIEAIELLPHDRPRLSVSEAYRSLRTALLLSSAEDLRVVAVTSAGSGEGKTATSANLAVVMAQLGQRVLLIDGDLRKPRLHEVFGVTNRAGLVNVLAGGEDPAKVVALTNVPSLSLMPSGPIPPNPSELLASDRMRELLRRARGLYDFVIIDTPPVLAVTDATIIGSRTDGVVLCLRAGKVLREDARTCRDRLVMSEVKILGAVLNRHRETTGSGRKYYYYEAYAADETSDSAA
jgi:capsular exopolysaccharide synthesis family protein